MRMNAIHMHLTCSMIRFSCVSQLRMRLFAMLHRHSKSPARTVEAAVNPGGQGVTSKEIFLLEIFSFDMVGD